MGLLFRRTPAQRARSTAKLPVGPESPASILVRPDVLRAIADHAAAADESETGGPLLGTAQRSWNGDSFTLIASILGTVTPGPAIRGEPLSVALGAGNDGERAASALRWWRAVTGLDLLHLGDWHVHPFGSPLPSSGDRLTAERMRSLSAEPLSLAAIAVGKHDRREELEAEGHVARSTEDRVTHAEVRFYRETEASGLVPVPIRIEEEAIPALPPLPWHVADPARFAAECRLLDAAGFRTAIDAAPNGCPGLSLRVQRDGGRALTVATGPGYPQRQPALFDDRGRPVAPRSRWSPDRFLVDLMREASP